MLRQLHTQYLKHLLPLEKSCLFRLVARNLCYPFLMSRHHIDHSYHHCLFCSATCATLPIRSLMCLLHPWYTICHHYCFHHIHIAIITIIITMGITMGIITHGILAIIIVIIILSPLQLSSGVNAGSVLNGKDLLYKGSPWQRVSRLIMSLNLIYRNFDYVSPFDILRFLMIHILQGCT